MQEPQKSWTKGVTRLLTPETGLKHGSWPCVNVSCALPFPTCTISIFYNHALDQQTEAGRGLSAAAQHPPISLLVYGHPVPTRCPKHTGRQEGGLATDTTADLGQ